MAKKKTDDKVETTKDVKEAKEKAPKIEIIRGRMPLPVVWMIKFGAVEETPGALAVKFRTTVGKINDIKKDSNFGYIKEDYVPSADMIEKAKVYASQLDDKSVTKEIEAMTAATDEQNAAFTESRKGTRKPREKAPETVEAPAKTVSDNELDELTA